MKIQMFAQLFKQVRDAEDEVTVTFKCPASEFHKVITIPTQTLLELTVTDVNTQVNSQGDIKPDVQE
jgi:hypothetical protein